MHLINLDKKFSYPTFYRRKRDHTPVSEGVWKENQPVGRWSVQVGGPGRYQQAAILPLHFTASPFSRLPPTPQLHCSLQGCFSMFNSHNLRGVLRGFHLPRSTCVNIPFQDLSSAADYRQGQFRFLLVQINIL